MSIKKILVLARRDHTEAMRVAAGLTISGHSVRLVFMNTTIADTPENSEQAEMIELCDIEPETTVAGEELPYLDSAMLSIAFLMADDIVTL